MHRKSLWQGALLAGALGLCGCDSGSKPEQADPDPVVEEPGENNVPDAGGGDGPVVQNPGNPNEIPTPDAGTPVIATPMPPNGAGWTFYGSAQGAPVAVLGVTADEGGNIWVAGGEEGLFLLEKDATQFRKFTLADGLRPFGYMADGSEPPGEKYLKVISVSGGPPGVVFVGYQGRRAAGRFHCESEWDEAKKQQNRDPDPSIYKSGDADRVTLNGAGISVVHYDISSGPNVVADEPPGREKLCDVKRIVYDGALVNGKPSVWFGANHGFARGDATYGGNPTCNGQLACSGVEEHTHPVPRDSTVFGGDFLGIAPIGDGNVWVGGDVRSTQYHYASLGFWRAQVETENKDGGNQFDIWPDNGDAAGPNKDVVSAMAYAKDGTLWAASFVHGIARLNNAGQVIGTVTRGNGLPNDNYASIAADPLDDGVWAGASFAGGITRIVPGLTGLNVTQFGFGELGELANLRVNDIQQDRSQLVGRRLLIAFTDPEPQNGISTGAVGLYTGN